MVYKNACDYSRLVGCGLICFYVLSVLLSVAFASGVWPEDAIVFFGELSEAIYSYKNIADNVRFYDNADVIFFLSVVLFPIIVAGLAIGWGDPGEEFIRITSKKKSGALGVYIAVFVALGVAIFIFLPGEPGSGFTGRFNERMLNSPLSLALGLILIRVSSATSFLVVLYYLRALSKKHKYTQGEER